MENAAADVTTRVGNPKSRETDMKQFDDHQPRRSTIGIPGLPPPQGLYHPAFEHDACGVGFLCNIKGKGSNKIVLQALEMLENMNHRGACGCEQDSGDGAGIMVATPDKFFRREAMKWGFKLPKA